jgi:hypothetical protein
MLWVMIRKECLNNLLELRFLVCGGLCIFLAVVSVVVLRADLATKQADYHSNREIYRTEAAEFPGPVLRHGKDPRPHGRGFA